MLIAASVGRVDILLLRRVFNVYRRVNSFTNHKKRSSARISIAEVYPRQCIKVTNSHYGTYEAHKWCTLSNQSLGNYVK